MPSQDYVEILKQRILKEGVLDSEGVHHQFASSLHGRKIDMDKIKTGSEFYQQWMAACVKYIQDNYKQQPDVIIGVANGANRMAVSIAAGLGNGTIGLMTEKESPKSSKFHKSVTDVIGGYKPRFALVVEDVGTAGTTSATAAAKARQAGAQRVGVLNTWQRQNKLEKLDQAGIEYASMIVEPLPTYSPDDCAYCKAGIKLIEHE